ncbi:MAG: hypothetical protein PVI58_06900 [Desulfobacterales bacterium]|jgi:hypothetical protein
MKNIQGWVILLLSCYFLISCSAISKMTATEQNLSVAEEESIETSTPGVLIKVDQKSSGQNELMDAVYLLERLYGKPVVVTNGGITHNGGSVVRYALYFDVSESLYSVVIISGGRITSIDTMNKGNVILGPAKVSVDSIIPDSNVKKILEAGETDSSIGG